MVVALLGLTEAASETVVAVIATRPPTDTTSGRTSGDVGRAPLPECLFGTFVDGRRADREGRERWMATPPTVREKSVPTEFSSRRGQRRRNATAPPPLRPALKAASGPPPPPAGELQARGTPSWRRRFAEGVDVEAISAGGEAHRRSRRFSPSPPALSLPRSARPRVALPLRRAASGWRTAVCRRHGPR